MEKRMSRLFRRRKPPAPPEEPPSDSDAVDAVLDSLASVVRAYAQELGDSDLFSGPEGRRRCEAWVRHALNGSPDPSRKALSPNEAPKTIPLNSRNWAGLRHEYRVIREAEIQHQGKLGTALRGTVLEIVGVLHRALQAGQGLDADLSARSRQLKTALAGGDIESLRRASHEVAASLEHTLEQRELVQDGLVRVLGQRLRQVRDELREETSPADTDPLTNLANRPALDHRLHASVTLGHFAGQTECLLVLEVDDLEGVIEAHGKAAGDRILVGVSECLARTIIRRSDFVARHGSYEFAVILSDTELDSATAMGARLLEQAHDLSVPLDDGSAIKVTASCGVADLRPEDTRESWFEAADQALREAKGAGRGLVHTRPARDIEAVEEPTLA